MSEKKVVVPTKIHTRCPNKNHETNAPHSSAFHGRMLLIENHLKRTRNRCRNPLAAASNSSFVGRCGILGKCRYLDMESASDSCSDAGGSGGTSVWVLPSTVCPGTSGSCLGVEAAFLSASPFPFVLELLALVPGPPRPFLAWLFCSNHTCLARWLRLARCPELPARAESAAAVHVVTTAPVDDGLELRPSSSRPPVQLLRTFFG